MSSKPTKLPALGRGLGALLENSNTDITSVTNVTTSSVAMLSIQFIEANPFNPRTHFEKDALYELCNSILTFGIIQPLTVRKLGRDKYQLISGERRFRASQMINLKEVPCYIRVANDQSMLEMALVENIQRENLNAIEIAVSYERLLDECGFTQEQLSEKIAKSRSNIANHVRLLKLPIEIQAAIRDNLITMGHGRSLLSIIDVDEQRTAFYQIISEKLSVRDIENIVKTPAKLETFKKDKNNILNSQEKVDESFLSDKLGSKVSIQKTPSGKGKMIIQFNSDANLNRIIALLKE
jgi:ParB family transcriptional regulator, chromosome partitioning protein